MFDSSTLFRDMLSIKAQSIYRRYDIGEIQIDPNRPSRALATDEIEQTELCRKAEALAQRTASQNKCMDI